MEAQWLLVCAPPAYLSQHASPSPLFSKEEAEALADDEAPEGEWLQAREGNEAGHEDMGLLEFIQAELADEPQEAEASPEAEEKPMVAESLPQGLAFVALQNKVDKEKPVQAEEVGESDREAQAEVGSEPVLQQHDEAIFQTEPSERGQPSWPGHRKF